MLSFKSHHFPKLNHFLKAPNTAQKDLIFGLSAHGILSAEGALVFALAPVIFLGDFGSAKMAGVILMFFTLVQVLLNPLAGAITDTKGIVKVLKFAVWFEFLGTIFWAFSGVSWGIYIFILGYFMRWAFFLTSSLVLSRSKKNSGGFWFGIRKEILALSNFIGLSALPFFLIEPHWPLLITWTMINNLLAWILLSRISPDKTTKKSFDWKKVPELFNYWKILKSGFSFIKKNHKYPLFNLGNNIFEGFFFGAIWFLFPIHLAEIIRENENSFALGIYELVTIFFAFFCGIIADRIDWRRLEIFSWILTVVLIWILVFWHSLSSLIFIGFFIGLASNLFSASSYHVLALFDDDHAEDGRYASFAEVIRNIGFLFSPVICGILYEKFGFQAGLLFLAVIVSILAVWMLFLAFSLKIIPHAENSNKKF